MIILGISAYYHDSAAALLRDGEIVAAAQEERFTRKRHDPSFPRNAVAYCLQEAGTTIDRVDVVAFYEKPFLKFERLLQTYLEFAPRGFLSFITAIPLWIKEKVWMKEVLRRELKYDGKMVFPEHHQSHAASAFFPSPFGDAAILTMDGVGEWATSSYGTGVDNKISILAEQHFPHSLGLLYSAFTYYTGFCVNSGEYKVMGLAPYGEPRYKDAILRELVDLKDDGSIRMNMDYFTYGHALRMTGSRFDKLFGGRPRKPESSLTQREMDLARSVQEVTEEAVTRAARHVHRETGMRNLCLAGGVALNCVANGRLLREGPFEKIWVQPAAGDAGGSLGAALFAWHQYFDRPRDADGKKDRQQGSYLGPRFTTDEIRAWLDAQAIPYETCRAADRPGRVADLIASGKVVGWFCGRMEFGPRALGARSILGDARSPTMQSIMNLKIKFRESFRPFAPSVLEEKAAEYFEIRDVSPYMLITAPVKQSLRREMTPEERGRFGIDKLNVVRSTIPAVTHVDYSARLQTVGPDDHPPYYELLREMDRRHDCAAIINTSFNVRGEPIVCTPQEAYRCFMRTEMDYLVLEECILDKAQQMPLEEDDGWKRKLVD